MQLKLREGSPYYWVSWTDDGGKRHRVSTKCKDKREALKAATRIVAETTDRAPSANVAMLFEILGAQLDSLSRRLDTIDDRLGRIERHLDIAEAKK